MSASDPCSGESRRFFPLRLCEVLENEFVALRGRMAVSPSWLLGPDDLHLDELLNRLRIATHSPATSPASAIRAKLEKKGFKVPEAGAIDDTAKDRLRTALNALLQTSEDLYDYRLLDRDALPWQLAEQRCRTLHSNWFRKTAPNHLGEYEQTLLNRLLLEAAFPPNAVTRVDQVRLARLFREIHAQQSPDAMYSALCLSGGGIRSAAFALGLLQGLARHGILEKFDYLSTVSGGGYVGSWLSTWVHRHPHGLAGVVDEMKPPGQRSGLDAAHRTDPEPGSIRFLRSYSHFLNPKAGLFSIDTWTWIGIYLRNLSLYWLFAIPFLLVLLALPHIYSALLLESRTAPGELFPILAWIASLAAISTIVCVTIDRPSLRDPATPEGEGAARQPPGNFDHVKKRINQQSWVLILGVAPLMLFCIMLTLLAWGQPPSKTPFTWDHVKVLLAGAPLADKPALLARIGFEHVVLWGESIIVVAWLISTAILPGRDWQKRLQELLVMLVAGAVTWLAVGSLSDFAWRIGSVSDAAIHLDSVTIYPLHLYAVLGVPAIALAALAGMTVFIGAISKLKWIEDEDREWWARFGSWILAGIVAWSVLGAIAIFGPPLLLEFPRLIPALGGVSGLIAVLLGKSSLTAAISGKGSSANSSLAKGILGVFGVNTLATMSAVALLVFLACLSLLGSAILKALIDALANPGADDWWSELRSILAFGGAFKHGCGHGEAWPWAELRNANIFSTPQIHLELVCQTPLPVVATAVLALLTVLIAANLLVNVNKFSLHAAYRIRIIRTFLGATRQDVRQPNPFTGFDPLDNVQMHELQPGLLRDADFTDLDGFVSRLHKALIEPDASAAGILANCLCSPEHDRFGLLASRLRNHRAGQPVLKSLQRDLLETLNRVLQTARLDRADAFGKPSPKPEDFDRHREAADWYFARGNPIFANRLLIECAFPGDIRKFDFPPPPPHKLMHVINLTLNLVKGQNLAWQERKAAPFSVSPMHAGSYYLGYRASRDYGGKNGISLGTAAAISGAAVSPCMGYSSSPVTGLLLALFNVRLGWWLGNPGVTGTDTYWRAEPRLSLRPLLSEALGLTDDRSPYVYLTDGGHFENLGLFEMVLRRCRLIVVSDAGADPDYKFEDLGNAIRKIRVDLGIPITFPDMPIHRHRADDHGGRYCAVGRIQYSHVDGDAAPDGILIYFKPVLCGDEPQDVLEYAARFEAFPQESTLDQFFGESQFESYRQLGEFALEQAWGTQPATGKPWAEDFVERIHAHVQAAESVKLPRRTPPRRPRPNPPFHPRSVRNNSTAPVRYSARFPAAWPYVPGCGRNNRRQ